MAGLKVWGTYYWPKPNQLNRCWDMQYVAVWVCCIWPPPLYTSCEENKQTYSKAIYNKNWMKRQKTEFEREIGKLSTALWLVSLFIIISDADILGVPKEITMLQQEVSHLFFLACWPECLNPVSIRMEALYLSSFMHITGGCHWLSISDNLDWIHHIDNKFA